MQSGAQQCAPLCVWSLVELRMKYVDGQEVRSGDRVKLGQDEGGIVVASIDTGEYSEGHSAAQWVI
jgi:predicted RecA/RadA family phage recombinase